MEVKDFQVGVVTKSQERFMGKQVYTTLVDFGALPAAGVEKYVPHGIADLDQFGIDYGRSFVDQGNGNRHGLVYPNAVANGFWRAKINETDIAIQSGEDRTNFTAKVGMWFTKASEQPEEPGEPGEPSGGTGLRVWESDWFPISAGLTADFAHHLALEAPWRCIPRLAMKVKTAQAGWGPEEVLFLDGTNCNGRLEHAEMGWTICIDEDKAHIVFGNSADIAHNLKSGGYGVTSKNSVECKLLINY